MRNDLIIVGGGAAGLMAACIAAQAGCSVLLAERNERMGRKLLITGKGRCNVTNDCSEEEFLRSVPTNSKFLFSCIHGFSPADAMVFFRELGVPLKTERGKRVFPVSDKASDVVEALTAACQKAGVRFTQGRVAGVLLQDGKAVGIRCAAGVHYAGASGTEAEYAADAVLLATGGASYPNTGSTGDGYTMARACGHTVTEIRPSLVPLVSRDECCADMQGLSLRNVELTLRDTEKAKPVFRELGEMLFTHYGMSGPLVLSASAHIRPFVPGRWSVELDFKPGLTEAQLDDRLLRDFSEFANKDFCNSLEKLLPRKLIPIIVQRSGVPPFTKVHDLTREQRKALTALLKCFSIAVDGFRPVDEAIITAGGVSVKEVDPKTMESKLVPGLYFAGELLDLDAYTGGFNLQIAWATAAAAARSVILRKDAE